MTEHYFENSLVKLHYYKFGMGQRSMLCFHGYGMHGKQFRMLANELGSTYTFIGFDLFFHKETKLSDQSIAVIKKGITKKELAQLITEFCTHENIDTFSVLGYSMGTHYATAITEELPEKIDEYIVAAPASLNPGKLIRYFSTNKIGNKLLEKLALSEKILVRLLRLYKNLGLMDNRSHDILYKEICTSELRFAFYASLTYLRYLDTEPLQLKKVLQQHHIKSIFIFGKRDKMYPVSIGKKFIPELSKAEVVILDENHEMINQNFVSSLSGLLL